MENIRKAVERARATLSPPTTQPLQNFGSPRARAEPNTASRNPASPRIGEIELSSNHLLSNRIFSQDGADHRSRPFDMLRTQVLQAMQLNGWKVLGITSPTAACGKTLTAVNLAFSIARQHDQSVVLLDLDLRKPRIAPCLGLKPSEGGVLNVLRAKATLRSAITTIRAGDQRIAVLPTTATKESSELMGCRAMRSLLQDVRRDYQSHIVILDLPPILSGDDVIALLPQIDCVLLVAAVGVSKISEVEECNRHLQSSHLIRLVVNKATDANSKYYYQS
jgi:protein-tyrosine kinase